MSLPAIRCTCQARLPPSLRAASIAVVARTNSRRALHSSRAAWQEAAPAPTKPSISSCPAGTKWPGLVYRKNQPEAVALADEEYPSWLWELTSSPSAAAPKAGGVSAKVLKKRMKELSAAEREEAEAEEAMHKLEAEIKHLRQLAKKGIKAANDLKGN